MIGLAELTPSARYANTSEEKGKEFDRRASKLSATTCTEYKINTSIRASVGNYAFDGRLGYDRRVVTKYSSFDV